MDSYTAINMVNADNPTNQSKPKTNRCNLCLMAKLLLLLTFVLLSGGLFYLKLKTNSFYL